MKYLTIVLFFLSLNLLYFTLSAPLTYQVNPDLEFLFNPNNENANIGGFRYLRELRTGGPRLYFGKNANNGVNFPRPNRLWNGNIFEGEEIDVADPHANLNIGTFFGLGMWIYIMEITGTHTLFCKQQPTATDPGIHLCLSFDVDKFFWQVRDTSIGNLIAMELYADPDVIDIVPMTDMVP